MALRGSPWHPVQVISRSIESAGSLAEACGIEAFSNIPADLRQDLDLVIICSTDHVIGEIANTYSPFKGAKTVFVHTAGSVAIDALAPLGPNVGAFYPLQTFTRGHLANFSVIPIFLEGSDDVQKLTRPLARHLSGEVHQLDSAGRLRLHLGAVFASNFANFMWILAEDSLYGLDDLDLKVYGPLVQECASKAFRYGPSASQTGPAKRGDTVTMDKHLQILRQEEPDREKLYRLVSAMIQQRFDRESNPLT